MYKFNVKDLHRLKTQEHFHNVVLDETVRQRTRTLKTFKLPNMDPKKNSCKDTNEKNKKLTSTQYLFYETVKKMKEPSVHRGLIGWLSTGSGKTTIASGIINAFADTERTVYYISKHDALKPHVEFEKVLEEMYDTKIEKLKEKLKIMSIASFANRLVKKDINLSKAVIIIDEAQYLFAQRAVPQFRDKHRYVIKTLLGAEALKSYVFILTATPGDDVDECLTLINIVRRQDEELCTFNTHTKHLLGKLFYLNMSKDLSIFPKLTALSSNHPLTEKIHLGRYMEKLKASKGTMNDVKTLQKWSNNLFKSDNFSEKIQGIFALIKKHPGKHYIYSQYGKQGISDLAKYLEKMGYKKASKTNMNKETKKYILAKASDKFNTSVENNPVMKKFNSLENMNGSNIELFLATDSYNTGIDLKDVRHVHFMEPSISHTDVIQGIGRGVRMCSHAHLPKKDWKVTVHTHFSVPKLKSDSIDRTVNENSISKYNVLNVLLMNLKRYALDCKALNKFHGGDFKCANITVSRREPFRH